MPRKDKTLTGEDKAIWALAMADVTPAKGRTAPASEAMPPVKTKTPVRARAASLPAPVQTQKSPPARELDKRTRERFESGKMQIEATLDLHGYDRGRARQALNGFLIRAWEEAKRCVLVVTGKGQGILRSQVPEWVEEPDLRSIVLRVSPARQRDGGNGAFYVLLRRQRPE